MGLRNVSTKEDWEEIFSRRRPIVVDTNFFIACHELKVFLPTAIDNVVESGYILLLSSGVISELRRLAAGRRVSKTALALEMAQRFASLVDENLFLSARPRTVDEEVLELAWVLKEFGSVLASADQAITQAAHKKRIPVINVEKSFLRMS